jgi:hypothetical protein
MSLVIECSSFTATPIGEGKVRLDIVNPEKKPTAEIYEAAQARKRLTEILGRQVSGRNLAYWRDELGLPFQRIGPKKFTYLEKELTDWAHSRLGSAL